MVTYGTASDVGFERRCVAVVQREAFRRHPGRARGTGTPGWSGYLRDHRLCPNCASSGPQRRRVMAGRGEGRPTRADKDREREVPANGPRAAPPDVGGGGLWGG